MFSLDNLTRETDNFGFNVTHDAFIGGRYGRYDRFVVTMNDGRVYTLFVVSDFRSGREFNWYDHETLCDLLSGFISVISCQGFDLRPDGYTEVSYELPHAKRTDEYDTVTVGFFDINDAFGYLDTLDIDNDD